MQTQKRSIVIQIILFTVFFFMGIDYVLKELIVTSGLWFRITEVALLSLILALGIIWFLKVKKDAFVVFDKKYITLLYVFLSIVFGALVLTLLSTYFGEVVRKYLYVIAGVMMSISSILGNYVSFRVYFSNNAGND